MQHYHSNASTNIHIRTEIKNSTGLSLKKIAQKFAISVPTVLKWRKRECQKDLSSKPKKIHYALTQEQKALIVSIRKSLWISIEEIYEMMTEIKPDISYSSVYRELKRNHLNKLPEKEQEKIKKFATYDPGYIHIDITYLPKIDGVKNYLFVAIDRATRVLFFKIYHQKSAQNAEDFLQECINFFPFKISHILTDNGLEFSNKRYKSKKGKTSEKHSLFDKKCIEYGIEHRLTKPYTPKTNGMVERVNATIKSQTIAKINYKNLYEMKKDLYNFLYFYNLNRRHSALKKELSVKTPFNAFHKLFILNPTFFNKKPYEFQKNILLLKKLY